MSKCNMSLSIPLHVTQSFSSDVGRLCIFFCDCFGYIELVPCILYPLYTWDPQTEDKLMLKVKMFSISQKSVKNMLLYLFLA